VAVTALLAFANVRVLLYRAFANQILELPGCITADVNRDAPLYFGCLRRMIWPWADGWPALRIYGLFPRPDLFVICALYCAGWIYFAGKLLEESRPGPRLAGR
jgi:hypothetical protein